MTLEIINDNKWHRQYVEEANKIRNVISNDLVAIYHIGATAMPKMKARAIIDILIVVKNRDLIEEMELKLKQLDYFLFDNSQDCCCLERKMSDFKLYLFSAEEVDMIEKYISFTLYLKEYPDIAKKYISLKERLDRTRFNSEKRYNKGKKKFIKTIEKPAVSWYRSKNIRVV